MLRKILVTGIVALTIFLTNNLFIVLAAYLSAHTILRLIFFLWAVNRCKPNKKEDPDTLVRKEGKEAFERRIMDAMPLSDFLFETLRSQVDINTREGKAQFASKANKLIQKMHNSLFKDLLIEELSSIVGLSQQHLESKITAEKPSQATAVNKVKPARGQQVENNRTRLAVALLVQNPQLAAKQAIPDSFRLSSNKGLVLLFELQQMISQNPEISSAALIERFRDTAHENALNLLSMLQMPETENSAAMVETYKDLVNRLHIDDRYDFLDEKMRNNPPLSDVELQEYQSLMKKIIESKQSNS